MKVDADELRRMSADFAAAHGGDGGRDPRAGRPPLQPRQPEGARRGPVRRDEAARRPADGDRRLGHRRHRAAEARRPGPRPAGPRDRLAAAQQAALDLYRGAAAADQPGDGPRPHRFGQANTSTGRISAPSRTCRTSRSGPRRAAASAGPSSPSPAMCWSAATTARSSCGCWPTWPTCRPLREAFATGQDIHARTAAECSACPMEGMDPETRRRAKTINFGIIYGMSASAWPGGSASTPGEAGHTSTPISTRYPGIRDSMERTEGGGAAARLRATPFGRKLLGARDRATRTRCAAPAPSGQAINAPFQGGAAEVIKRAMVRVPERAARGRPRGAAAAAGA